MKKMQSNERKEGTGEEVPETPSACIPGAVRDKRLDGGMVDICAVNRDVARKARRIGREGRLLRSRLTGRRIHVEDG